MRWGGLGDHDPTRLTRVTHTIQEEGPSAHSAMSSSSSSVRTNVLTAYKRLLTLAKMMPNEKQRVKAVGQIRSEFRKNVDEHSEDAVKDMLKKANSSMSFLNIVTPKRAGTKGQEGRRASMVFGKNKNGARDATATTNWHGGNMDPDSVARHHAGLRRAGFRDNSHAKGVF